MNISSNEAILFVAEIVLYSFQFSVLFVLLKKINKEFNSAFYHLLLAIFISDFVYFVFFSVFSLRFPAYGIAMDFFKSNQWFASFSYTISSLLSFIQFWGQTLVSFNRFTRLWLPLKHQKIWAKKWYLIVVLFIPFTSVSYRIPYGGYYTFNEKGLIDAGYTSKEMEQFALIFSAVFLILCASLSLMFSIFTIVKFALFKKDANFVTPDKQIGLLIYSILLLAVQLLRVVYIILSAVILSNTELLSALRHLLPLIVDLHAWFAAIAILILNPTTRKTYLKFYGIPNLFYFLKNVWRNSLHYSSAVHDLNCNHS